VPWNLLRWSFLLLSLVPSLAEVGLVLTIFWVGKEKYREIIRQPINWALGILSLWLIINCFLAGDRLSAALGLANYLPFFALFVIVPYVVKTPSQLRELAWLGILSVLPIVILGLGQLWGNWSLPYLLDWALIPKGEPSGRMSSVFMYANILAAYLSVVFPLTLGLWIDTYRYRKNLKLLWFLSATVIAEIVGLVLTSSRNCWGIAFVICIAFSLYVGWHWLVTIIGAIASIIFWSAFGINPSRNWLRQIVPNYIWGRLADEMYPNRPQNTLRTTQWQFCWDLTQHRPWTGWGIRNFTTLYQAETGEWLGHPHNLFLMLSLEIGIPATLLLSALVAHRLSRAIMLMKNLVSDRDRLILFTYLMAFTSSILFNLLDVSIYDLRVNTLAWLLLSTISSFDPHSEN
jgi:O-antigen ligase